MSDTTPEASDAPEIHVNLTLWDDTRMELRQIMLGMQNLIVIAPEAEDNGVTLNVDMSGIDPLGAATLLRYLADGIDANADTLTADLTEDDEDDEDDDED